MKNFIFACLLISNTASAGVDLGFHETLLQKTKRIIKDTELAFYDLDHEKLKENKKELYAILTSPGNEEKAEIIKHLAHLIGLFFWCYQEVEYEDAGIVLKEIKNEIINMEVEFYSKRGATFYTRSIPCRI